MTALILASDKGHTENVKLLLSVEGIDVNKADNHGNTALILASHRGHTEVVKLLLSVEGIDVNKANNDGCTALFKASHKEMKALLRVKGAK